MRAPTANARSILIGTLLAALSAGCLIAFTLVAGSADYPTTGRVLAVAPPQRAAAPVTLATGTERTDNGSPRIRPDAGADPTAPIVLGTRISRPEAEDGRDRQASPRRRSSDRDGSRKADDRDRDTDGVAGPARVAKPVVKPPQSRDFQPPRGHAYGHDKGAHGSSASSSSKGNGPPAHAHAGSTRESSGPPAHATANGHDDSAAPSKGTSTAESSSPPAPPSGPPAHASANGQGDVPGPPAHAAANGHDKAAKS